MHKFCACPVTMDKLGQFVYDHPELTYKYKGVVETPTLGMVDDVLSVIKCSSDTVKMNFIINSVIENKKLKLSTRKCNRIHIQNKRQRKVNNCPEIKVHKDSMANSSGQKYLGELLNSYGTVRKTIEERKNK